MARKCLLTTFDNPYDPYTEFDSWYRYDTDKGYNSCSQVDRFSNTSEQLSEVENDDELERAIDEIIKFDVRNIYKKIVKEV